MFRLKEEKNLHVPPAVGWWVLVVCLMGLWCGDALALGTAAGTPISNTATVSYSLGGDPAVLTASASNSFQVLEVIDVSLIWQDADSVPVNSPHDARALTFLLTNTGNGPEMFRLNADETPVDDQFNPGTPSLWIESNGTAGLQADDTLYAAPGIVLDADAGVVIYTESSIPAGLADGDRGTVRLSAAAQTPGAAGQPPGTLLPGAGFNTVDAVVGTTGALRDAAGSYAVTTVAVVLSKNIVRMVDPFGGDHPYTGARVTYRITVAVTGSGTAGGLVVSDPIPGDMTYAPGSMILDGAPQTDAADADPSDFNITAAGTVTVNLSDRAAPAAHVIEFDTTIN